MSTPLPPPSSLTTITVNLLFVIFNFILIDLTDSACAAAKESKTGKRWRWRVRRREGRKEKEG